MNRIALIRDAVRRRRRRRDARAVLFTTVDRWLIAPARARRLYEPPAQAVPFDLFAPGFLWDHNVDSD